MGSAGFRGLNKASVAPSGSQPVAGFREVRMTVVDARDTMPMGLTTTKAPFIEQAQEKGQLYITQPYDLYTEANHEAWRKLYARMGDRWQRYANKRFLQGIDNLCLDPKRVPRL